jgi:hypothetical protein
VTQLIQLNNPVLSKAAEELAIEIKKSNGNY